jgi:hypothetical protein
MDEFAANGGHCSHAHGAGGVRQGVVSGLFDLSAGLASEVSHPGNREHTMTKQEGQAEVVDLKGLSAGDEAFVRSAVEALVQAAPEAEMTEAIGAGKGERTETRAEQPIFLMKTL